MPAIDLARLKTQTVRLTEKFDESETFLRALHELLDLYTNRTMRSSHIARRLSLPTYRTPLPVLRQIEREMAPLAEMRPTQAVVIVNALWESAYFETRLLAARLIGDIPPAQAMQVLTNIPGWLLQSKDREVQQALLVNALERFREEDTDTFLLLLEDWLKSDNQRLQAWGLRALIPLLSSPKFENLPAVFRVLEPAIESVSPFTQFDLQGCLVALERVSLTETLFFLREVLATSNNPNLSRILRRIQTAFSPQMQAGLREAIRPKSAE